MTALAGTQIADKIVPFDSADTYPTHTETYGLGGFRSVADLTARDAIPTQRRSQGMLVYVVGNNTTYQLFSGITNADWTVYTGAGTDALVSSVSAALYAIDIATSGNLYNISVATSANLYAIDVATSGNLYAIIAATSASLYSTDVATSANLYAITLTTSGNLYSIDVATSANLYAIIVATSGTLATLTSNASANALFEANNYTDTRVTNLSAVVNGNYVHRTGSVNEIIDGNKIFVDNTTFNSNVTIQGALYAASGTFAVIAGVVSADSNLIELNVNDPGPGVTRGYAGVQIDRGTEVPYQFLFDENRDAFVVGSLNGPVSGGAGSIRELQVVATREDTPTPAGVAFWNVGTPSTCGGFRFITDGQFTYDTITGLSVNSIEYNPSVPSDWTPAPSAVFSALDQLASKVSGLSGNSSDLYNILVATSANLYAIDVATSGDLYAIIAATSASLYDTMVATSADLYAINLTTSGNLYSIDVATSSALYAIDIATSGSLYNINVATSANLYAIDVATSGNLYSIDIATSGNLYAIIAATSASLYSTVVATSANLYSLTSSTSAETLSEAKAYTDSVSASIAQNVVALMQGGTIACDITNYVYQVPHTNIGSVGAAFPIVSLTIPMSASILYVQGITNRTNTSFSVILSDVPDASGYNINWILFKPYGT